MIMNSIPAMCLTGMMLMLCVRETQGQSQPREEQPVLISNCLRQAPNGIAWVVRDGAAFVVNPEPGYDRSHYWPGPAAPDDSYHRNTFKRNAAQIILEWGRVGECVVGRITADQATDLDLTLSSGWPNWTGTFQGTRDGAIGRASVGATEFQWKLRASPEPKSTSAQVVTLALVPGQPAYLVAGLGQLPGFASVDATLEEARKQYLGTRPQASGDWGDFIGAIADNVNNTRIYASDNRLWPHTVSRGWFHTPNTQPYFCWDSFFTANLAAIDDPAVARTTVRAILSCQTSEGLVPNFGHWHQGVGGASIDRSQPPVGAWCVWKMHQRYLNDLDFLREVYPKLVVWHDWWHKYRDAKHDGLLEWGSTTGGFQEAQWETGWDDNLHFAGAQMVGKTMNCYAVDLCALWAQDAHYLALLADALGKPDDAARFRADQAAMNRRINEQLWNAQQHAYCSRFWDDAGELHPIPAAADRVEPSGGRFLTRFTPMNFYPLSSGAPDAGRAEDVLGLMTNPKKFWGKYLLPTLAYDDPAWRQQNYWRGKVWGPVNYIVFDGIKRYGKPGQIADYADHNVNQFMWNWTTQGLCGENYMSSNGRQSSDPHYTWGALLCLVGLESIVDVDDAGQIVLNGAQTRTISLKNIPLLGRRYDVKTAPGSAVLLRDGKVVLEARGDIVRGKGD